MSQETRTLLETALQSLKQDILRNMEAHTRDRNVPCTSGVREFQQLVSLYWDLEVKIGQKQGPMAETMAMCEDMAEAPPGRR